MDAASIQKTSHKSISFRFYVQTLSELLKSPRRYFSAFPDGAGMSGPLFFLGVSALIYTVAGVLRLGLDPVRIGAVLWCNAVGTVFIFSGMGWMTVRLMTRRPFSYFRIFEIFALASGVTLLGAWIPSFLILTEPWKWWIIGVGFHRRLSLSVKESGLAVAVSVSLMTLMFYALTPFIG